MWAERNTHATGLDQRGFGAAPRMCREPRAILVIDFPDFSRLADDQIPVFHEYVMRPVSEVMDAHVEGRLYDNTWGDAIIAIFDRAVLAARFSLELQARLAKVPFTELGMPAQLISRRPGSMGRWVIVPVRPQIIWGSRLSPMTGSAAATSVHRRSSR